MSHSCSRTALFATTVAAVGLCAVTAGAAPLCAQDATEQGVRVTGVVIDHATGGPLAGVTVSLAMLPGGPPARGTRFTDQDGRFGFDDVPPGTYRLLATAPDYRAIRDTLRVPEVDDLEVRIPLSTRGTFPPETRARTSRAAAVPGFERRRRTGSHFLITREDVLEHRPRRISEMLHGVPGGIVVPTPPYGYSLLLRGQCRPGIWLDGMEARGAQSIDQVVSPNDVEAVEVYHAFELPVEFGVNECGGILVWTRRGPDPMPPGEVIPGGGGIIKGLLAAVVLSALIILISR